MGVVYLAEHPRIGRKVAIKVLLRELSANAQAVTRFFNEARASSEIRNEHIVDVLDFGELADGSSYLVLEFLDGQTLTELLRKGLTQHEVLPERNIRLTPSSRSLHTDWCWRMSQYSSCPTLINVLQRRARSGVTRSELEQ